MTRRRSKRYIPALVASIKLATMLGGEAFDELSFPESVEGGGQFEHKSRPCSRGGRAEEAVLDRSEAGGVGGLPGGGCHRGALGRTQVLQPRPIGRRGMGNL